ncbi:MAG: hypothetical protein JOY64_29830 [Alphaproteobacteria bacterium]|nr:hypothetical protein [Alphaproteobacteria bacterium]MBV8411862.1 hypothetical protein [Alphaproteobacteria bacterium]
MAMPGTGRGRGGHFCIAAMMVLSACSVDGLGAASSEVFQADGARVVRSETYGIAVRTAADDAGITLGWSWTLALIPVCPDAPRPGTYRFGLATSGLRPIATVRRTGGVAIEINRRAIGVMLGFSEDGLLSRLPADASVVRSLVLTPDEPSRIEFRQFPETSLCS